jgi:dihydroorotase-like cyclic amidohydrolase
MIVCTLRKDALISHEVQNNHWGLDKLAKRLSTTPAEIVGLGHKKGSIIEGYDADLVVWDPYVLANTTTEGNYHRHKLTPYKDKKFRGKVMYTFSLGAVVYDVESGPYWARVCGQAELVKSTPDPLPPGALAASRSEL